MHISRSHDHKNTNLQLSQERLQMKRHERKFGITCIVNDWKHKLYENLKKKSLFWQKNVHYTHKVRIIKVKLLYENALL